MDDIEVVLAPNFASDIPHEVLGCDDTANLEAIDRAYRDLSRKYHPDRVDPDDPNSPFIFRKVSEAYAKARGGDDVPKTEAEAKRAYENKFGKYRRLYYNEGGLIGIPYSIDLRERLEETKHFRELMSLNCGRFRFTFFRTWLIKEDMNWLFWLCEVILTWVVISFCVLAFMLESNPGIWETASKDNGQIINIAGGVALLFSQFILCFWYGFTRYPAGDKNYINWLRYGEKARTRDGNPVVDQDMEDIRRVCSYYLHQDRRRRFHPIMVLMCFPVVVIEQTAAFAFANLVCVILWLSRTRHRTTSDAYAFQVSKSLAALVVIMGYYMLWVFGNKFCKLAGVAGLLVNQNLCCAILFDKSVFEFLQSFVFGNAFLLTITQETKQTNVRQELVSAADANHCSTQGLDRKISSTSKRVSYAGIVEIETGAGNGIEMGVEGSDSENVKDGTRPAYVAVGSPLGVSAAARSGAGPSSVPKSILKRSSSQTKHTPGTPETTQDAESLNNVLPDHDDNVSLDLGRIDQGGIEAFHEDDENTSMDTRLNAEKILEDLEDNAAASMIAAYKDIKRNIENAFYSSRIAVLPDLDSSSGRSGEYGSSRSDFDTISFSRIDTKESSFVGTVSLEDGTQVLTMADVDDSTIDPLKVSEIEVNPYGRVLVDGENVPVEFEVTAIKKPSEYPNSKPWRNYSVRKWMLSGRPMADEAKGEESKHDGLSGDPAVDDHASDSDQVAPPIQTVYTETMVHQPTLDDDLSRTG